MIKVAGDIPGPCLWLDKCREGALGSHKDFRVRMQLRANQMQTQRHSGLPLFSARLYAQWDLAVDADIQAS